MNDINSTAWTTDQWAEFHQGLERFDEARDPSANMNDRAYVLIGACLEEGVNTVPQIIEAVAPLGFNKRHLGALLTQGKGGWYQRDGAGVVSLKPD
jgi:hypothetical protein